MCSLPKDKTLHKLYTAEQIDLDEHPSKFSFEIAHGTDGLRKFWNSWRNGSEV